ncbi:hypothetical protein CBR_g5707 [Chara braunii]|uniref:Uncharacterized protein n=1 Tax=Chara braunii TaxID=69332 RepID=A0A388KJ43_CHABU|nr:hypothetical protein CBR_g5707 [Chara braunii]|eukprot:GBG70074.1 hypothetical protein CBR_g5707 [Chara braunii]
MPIFYPYRALGYITDETPFSVVRRGADHTVIVSIGKAWQIYSCSKLTLQFVGPELEKRITAVVGKISSTFVAYGRKIGVFSRGTQVETWTGHTGRVLQMLVLGNYLLSLGDDKRLLIWRTGRAGGLDSEIQLDDSFTPTCLVHPETYLNKVLICSEEGRLQLWNIVSKKVIYEFKGWGSAVRCCVSSPALDVVGLGCANGCIHVLNLKYDETVMTLVHTTKGPVTALSFRTDGQPMLAAGGTSGEITIWNLEKQKLQSVIRTAHDGTISSLYFLPKEPMLISSAADNSLKMWIFDSDDGEARLLRFRSGHSAPPTCIQYYGQGRRILSAGQDRSFRLFSTVQDQQSKELSQGRLASKAKRYDIREEELRLPRVIAFAAADVRERDWCNVVTCHEGDSAAYTWRLQNFVIGEHILRAPGTKRSSITAVAISACGNFAVVGNAAGCIHRFNLQSGLHRGVFATQPGDSGTAHDKAVTGLECHSCNKSLVSAGYEGTLKIWGFRSRALQAVVDVGSPVVKLKFHSGNGLAVAVCDDQVLRLYDVENVRLVRKFDAHMDRITDVSFSQDGRWLLSSSMDSTLRIFDVVAARPLDTMRVDVPITSLSLSPHMDLIATTHVNRNGIYLWANHLLYSGLQAAELQGSGASKVIDVTHLPAVSMALPSSKSEEEEEEEEVKNKDSQATEEEAQGKDGAWAEDKGKEMESTNTEDELSGRRGMATRQLDPELVTLSLLPRAQWKGLVDLDIIKLRNKPAAPSKKPERAPFFLPTLPSLAGDPVFALPSSTENKGGELESDAKVVSRVRKSNSAADNAKYVSPFTQLLHKGASLNNYAELTALLHSMSPSAIDAEVRMMMVVEDEDGNCDDEERLQEIGMVLDFLIRETESNASFELIQAFMQLFLKVHGEVISGRSDLQSKARTLLAKQRCAWQRLDSLFQNLRCSVSFLTNSQQ